MLKLVKLTPFAKRKPHQLSGGQRQRVALARSLAKKPKVLLLDEPLGALDKKLREETQFELTDLQDELGLTFVIVTHDQEEAMTLADRIAVMDHGKIVQVGTPAEIYEQPNSRYVADFIGDINMLEGARRSPTGDGTRPPRMQPAPARSSRSTRTSTAASRRHRRGSRSGRRRSAISLDTPADAAVNAIAGEVWDIGYLGDVSIYHVRLPTGATVKATLTNRTRLVERPITWEDKVWLTWPPRRRRRADEVDDGRRHGGTHGRGDAARRSWARWLVVVIPYVWLLLFFLVPFLIVLKISLLDRGDRAAALHAGLRSRRGIAGLVDGFKEFTVDNYLWLTEDALYIRAYLSSLMHRAGLDLPGAARRLSRSPTAWRARRRSGSRRW